MQPQGCSRVYVRINKVSLLLSHVGRLYEDAIEKCIKYEERQGEERPSHSK